MFGSHRQSSSGDVKRSCDFIGGSSSCYVTILSSLVSISIVVVDVFSGLGARFDLLLLISAITVYLQSTLLESTRCRTNEIDIGQTRLE